MTLKLIEGTSHDDHGLTSEQMEHILKKFADKDGFFIETFDLPENLGKVPCALYGPAMGDSPVPEAEVTYTVRGTRNCATRVVRGYDPRPTRKVTVIAGPHEEDTCVLYTAFGGPLAPKEPGDTSLATMEEIEESRKFWAEHALAE